eukprot:4753386-Pleurochrysis_carterae.AAC.1
MPNLAATADTSKTWRPPISQGGTIQPYRELCLALASIGRGWVYLGSGFLPFLTLRCLFAAR